MIFFFFFFHDYIAKNKKKKNPPTDWMLGRAVDYNRELPRNVGSGIFVGRCIGSFFIIVCRNIFFLFFFCLHLLNNNNEVCAVCQACKTQMTMTNRNIIKAYGPRFPAFLTLPEPVKEIAPPPPPLRHVSRNAGIIIFYYDYYCNRSTGPGSNHKIN